MKLILLSALICLSFTAVADNFFSASTSMVADADFSCALTLTAGGSGDTSGDGSTAKNAVFLASVAGSTDLSGATDSGFACEIAVTSGTSATNAWTIAGTVTGTCQNFTATASNAPVAGTAWTASEYVFNCTEIASVAGLETLVCAIYFDYGTLSLDLPTTTSIMTGIHVVTSSEDLEDISTTNDALISKTFTAGSGDSECEDTSSATTTLFAGASALVGASLFF